jgi:hypothetical protein
MKEVLLTNSNRVALVDDEDFERVVKWEWALEDNEHGTYARSGGTRLHRLILGRPPRGKECDHINGDGLDNQRHNLRFATHLQNMHNKRPYRGGESLFKGVARASKNRWRVHIRVNCISIYLGCFADEEEAARTYDNYAKLHFGEFARTNFPVKCIATGCDSDASSVQLSQERIKTL